MSRLPNFKKPEALYIFLIYVTIYEYISYYVAGEHQNSNQKGGFTMADGKWNIFFPSFILFLVLILLFFGDP